MELSYIAIATVAFSFHVKYVLRVKITGVTTNYA